MRRLLRELALTLGALAGLAGLALAVATLAFGLTPVVVTSGSMEPAIGTGSVTFTRTVAAGELVVGDVVAVRDAAGRRVMHRIEAISAGPTGSERTLTLRGDANAAADVDRYLVHDAERVVASVPAAGHVLAWLSSPAGLLTAGGLVALLLLVGFGTPVPKQASRDSAWVRPSATALGVVLVATAVSAGASTITRSRAAWQDAATARSGAFTTHLVQLHDQPECTNEGGLLGVLGRADITWSHVDRRYDYDYVITRVSNGAQAASGTVDPGVGAAPDSMVTLSVTATLLSLAIGGVDFDVTITPRLRSAPTWTAATSTTTRVHSANLLVGLSMRCGPA